MRFLLLACVLFASVSSLSAATDPRDAPEKEDGEPKPLPTIAAKTRRMQPMKIQGGEVHVVWMPYNWGFKGLSTGPSTNHITIDVGDPNTWCQETKACLVNVSKVEDAAV